MNIGMILDNAFPPDPRVENEALALIQKGHRVNLFCLDYSHREKEFEIINGINVYRKRLPEHLYRFSALAYTLPYYHLYLKDSIRKFIIDNNIEAIHIHDIQVARTVFNINRKLKLPLVLDLHENRPEIMKSYPWVTQGPGKFLVSPHRWKKFEHKYIHEADRLIVVTTEAKDHYLDSLSVPSEKIHVVPNYVRDDFSEDYKEEKKIIEAYKDRFVLIYIGDTGLRRGLDTAIQSLEILIPEVPDILLLIIGKSKTDGILKDMVSRKGWDDYVEFTGWQDPCLFPSFLLSSNIGICPLHRNIHHDTTYANKLFQYMAFGKPVIVSDCTAQENMVNRYRCGLVFKDSDIRDFAAGVLKLYRDQSYYDELSANAKKAVKTDLNWKVAGDELIRVYEEL